MLVAIVAQAQSNGVTFVPPMKIPLVLSANFGELRADHFHSGVDFKTQGRTGINVYAVDSGYISRVLVSPWGYGRALYVTHPSGYTTVYAHLDSFVGAIADSVQVMQYRNESFALDTIFTPDVFPVSRGQLIAKSGNSGSSGGAHLHFEVRGTSSETYIDPLIWFASKISDKVAPEPRLVALYEHDKVADGQLHPKQTSQLVSTGTNRYKCDKDFTAWGRVSVGIKAYDKCSGTNNIYGVRNVRLWVDDSLVYESCIDSIPILLSRYSNSFIDYNEWRNNKGSFIMRSYIQPGNILPDIYKTTTDGSFIINEARTYNCRYELTDINGNMSRVNFKIQGSSPAALASVPQGVLFDYCHDNEYATAEMNIHIPKGSLYDNYYFDYSSSESSRYYSHVHAIGNSGLPLQKWCELSIKLSCDTLPDDKYYMVRIFNGSTAPVIGRYEAGWYIAKVRRLGKYAIAADLSAPTITPHNEKQWAQNGVVMFKITDKGSGIATYRAEVDGQFCLFEYDAKKNMILCKPSDTPFGRGVSRTLVITVTDNCGNTQQHKQTIKW